MNEFRAEAKEESATRRDATLPAPGHFFLHCEAQRNLDQEDSGNIQVQFGKSMTGGRF